MNRNRILHLAILAAAFAAVVPCQAQPRAFTSADYARAEKFMNYNTTPLMFRASVQPNWLPDERMWYRVVTADGSEFILVDPARGTREPAFDQTKLAAALSQAAGSTYDGAHLPFESFVLSPDSQSISITVGSHRWRCDRQGNACATDSNPPPAAAGGQRGGRGGRGGGGRGGRGGGEAGLGATSPDGKSAVMIRDENLWVRDVASAKETQLTTDGVKDFGYATDNAGWTIERPSDRALVARFEEDRDLPAGPARRRRNVPGETTVGHPTLRAVEISAARRRRWSPRSSASSSTCRRRKVVRLQDAARPAPLDAVRRHRLRRREWATCSGVAGRARTLAFVSTSRDHKEEKLRRSPMPPPARCATCSKRRSRRFSNPATGRINWHYLPASNEVIWFSERDNWGQLYLYDLATGKLKNQITTGEGNVTQVLRVDEKARVIYFLAVGREKGRDPYFSHFYSVGFDGSNQKLLTPDDGNHAVTLSPSGKLLRRHLLQARRAARRRSLRDYRRQVDSPLWKRPTSRSCWPPAGSRRSPITVKARDGVTDLYGLMFKPTNLDPTKKYPIINHIYPGPQTGSVGSRKFSAGARRCAGAGGAGFHRGGDRRHGHARGAPRNSTRPISATWATTPCPTRWPA